MTLRKVIGDDGRRVHQQVDDRLTARMPSSCSSTESGW